MNIKSLLLGSAAALAVVSGAQAADAIVAAEPEPAEYVRVCDAFGTGYFYIPGTETCLKIGGRVRIQQDLGKGKDYAPTTKGKISASAKSDSEFGVIEGYIEAEGEKGGSLNLGDVYIAVGGFKAGRYGGLWDNGIGENVSEGSVPGDFKLGYSGSADAASFGIQIDELAAGEIGVVGQAGSTLGGLTLNGYVAFDIENSAANVKVIGSAELGPGTLTLGGAWFGDVKASNRYGEGTREWVLATAYAIKASDKITIAPDFEYFKNEDGSDGWTLGALNTFTIADGLTAKVNVNYNNADTFGGWVRLERTF
jgi:hypothetical protein